MWADCTACYDGKREVRVIDYADLNVPMLARMFDRRCRGYEAVGYTILLPASAVPGWPAEVPLPVDPQWKTSTRPACGGWFATALTRRWRTCSFMSPGTARTECRRGRSCPECDRGISLSPPGNAA